MYNIIERYMNNLKKDDVAKFAQSKGANLNESELEFTYNFVKKNWREVLKNPNLFDIDRYKGKYTPENFKKVKQVFNEYYQKFGSYL